MTASCRLTLGCWLIVGALTAGCETAAPLRTDTDVPAAFDGALAGHPAAWPSQAWYRGFSSDELNTLIDLATKNNRDMAGARARLEQADARARKAGAAILPGIQGGASADFLAGHSGNGSAHETDWSALLSTSYEVDFWGRNRATVSAAGFLATASRADRDTLALTTLAGVANGYFRVLALRERTAIARLNVEAVRSVLGVIQARYDAGMASPVDLATQKTALANAALLVPDLDQQEAEARAALALLVGRVPEGFRIQGEPLASLAEPVVAAGMPAELLTRRPDVFAAEANLQSAHADLAAARAALFPGLTLTAGAGLQNPALNAAVLTLPGVGPTLALGASLTQTIFDHGRLRAQRAEAEARDEELLAAYRSAIAAALADVENALGALHQLDVAREFQMERLAQSEQAFEGAKLRYQAGSSDLLGLLEAQRDWYAARDQFVLYRLARLQALIGLCKALGGGWTQATAVLTPAAQPRAAS